MEKQEMKGILEQIKESKKIITEENKNIEMILNKIGDLGDFLEAVNEGLEDIESGVDTINSHIDCI